MNADKIRLRINLKRSFMFWFFLDVFHCTKLRSSHSRFRSAGKEGIGGLTKLEDSYPKNLHLFHDHKPQSHSQTWGRIFKKFVVLVATSTLLILFREEKKHVLGAWHREFPTGSSDCNLVFFGENLPISANRPYPFSVLHEMRTFTP